jgi:large repetitive protein
MKSERFKRTKSVMASGAIALVVAALSYGVSAGVLRPSRSPLVVSSGTAFTVSSAIYPSPACSGSTAQLHPGVMDCAVLTVHNNLTVPITVQSLSSSVTSPPAGCPASDFSLPSFSGSLSVGAGATSSTSGLPISLIDTGTNQDACKGATISFAYTGSAQFTDNTSTALVASPTAPGSGQPIDLSATVTGANASTDPSLPTGTVSFNTCPTAACTSTTALGTGTIGAGGAATLNTSSLTAGVHYLQAVYGGQGTDYSASTSPVLTLTVGAPVTSSATTGSGTSGTSGVSTSPSSTGSIAFTGADIAGMVALALVMIGAGTFVVIAVRRRNKSAGSES